jgi:ribonuclease D
VAERVEEAQARMDERRGETARNAHGADDHAYCGETAPSEECPTWRQRVLIEQPTNLASLASTLAGASILAIDAEFAPVRVREPQGPGHRLAVLQLAVDNNYTESYVVDALRLADLAPLRESFERPELLKLFHGMGADARVLAMRGLVAANTLDLEAVSRSIFGQRESSLQSMLQRACGMRLDKSLQRADWARRPLTSGMVAYAARDAETTLALYGWLLHHYPWAVAAHLTPAGFTPAAVAPWIEPYLERRQTAPLTQTLAEAGLARDTATQTTDLLHALRVSEVPGRRARVMRLIADLELAGLADELRPSLRALPMEERAGAARALGRLRDTTSLEAIQALRHDPVDDVRQAARMALESMRSPAASNPRRAVRTSPGKWVFGESEDASEQRDGGDDWRSRLQARFGSPQPPQDEP